MKSTFFLIITILTFHVYAFKPTTDTIGSDNIFGNTHKGMTKNAIQNINYKLSDGNSIKFSINVIEQIMQANIEVDNGDSFGEPYRHCDDELIFECTDHLKKNSDLIIELLRNEPPSIEEARVLLGDSLHTLQDFYSHSNWVDIQPNTSAHLGNLVYSSPPKATHASIGNIFPDNWDDTQTCQWVVNGPLGIGYLFAYPDADLITGIGIHPTNNLTRIGLSQVTSGYFNGFLGISDPFGFKCDHGIPPFDNTRGINKDQNGQPSFSSALTAAENNTTEFVNRILSASGINESSIKSFMGINDTLNVGFVIDTSASMGSIIDSVKSASIELVEGLQINNPEVDVSFLTLSYGEGVGATTLSNTYNDALVSLNNITLGVPDDGGDCPERSTQALLTAINSAPEGSTLFLFTDASTKDEDLVNLIINSARNKNITIKLQISGNCSGGSDIDEPYLSIGNSDNNTVQPFIAGQSIIDNNVDTSSFFSGVHIGSIINDQVTSTRSNKYIKSSLTSILINGRQDEGTYHFIQNSDYRSFHSTSKSKVKSYPIFIDNTVSELISTINMDPLGEIRLFDPDGIEVVDGVNGASINITSFNQLINVIDPSFGEWTISITGEEGTSYEIINKMKTDIRFIDFSFAEEKGRPGHTGLYPIDGQPLTTEEQTVIGTFAGNVDNIELILKSLDGRLLGIFNLIESNRDDDNVTFSGTIELPNETFVVYARGIDKQGNVFERSYPDKYIGQSVTIKPFGTQETMIQGEQLTSRFIIKNTGLKDTFLISASDSGDYISSLSDSIITLAQDEEKIIDVILDVPALSAEPLINVTLNARSQSNDNSQNSAIINYNLNIDSDSDGVSDAEEKHGDNAFDGNGDGIADFIQNKVASFFAKDSTALVTMEIQGSGSFKSVKAVNSPDENNQPQDVDFLLNSINFKIINLTAGETTKVKIFSSANLLILDIYKYGVTLNVNKNHWYKYNNIEIENGYIIVTLKDGANGDDDLLENGTIVDPITLAVTNSETDSDNDNIPNIWEFTFGLNPLDSSDAQLDLDGDGLLNIDEFINNTDPTNTDTDGDGFSDFIEINSGSDPLDANSQPQGSPRVIPILSVGGIVLLIFSLIGVGVFFRKIY